MAKSWFLDYLGKHVAKSRVREICRLMELCEKDTAFVLLRFCDGAGMLPSEIIGPEYSEYNQRKFMPDMDAKVQGWCEANAAYFKFIELRGLTRFYERRKQDE